MTTNIKVIPDTEGVYGVTSEGEVRNLVTGVTLAPFYTTGDYLCVSIQFSTKPQRSTVKVHRLVAQAFIPNPEGKPYVNHIDGNKSNCRVENLEWVTPRENNLHAVALGLIASGENSYLAVLTEKAVLAVIEKLRNGARNIDLAREFRVAPNTIDDIRCNRTWRYIEREPIPKDGPKRKLTEEDVREIKQLFHLSNREIADRYAVAPATIDQIRKGSTWKHIS